MCEAGGFNPLQRIGVFLDSLKTLSVGGIFIENRCTKKPTHSVGEIFFYKTFSREKIVSSSYDFGMTPILKKNKNRFFVSL